MTSQGEQPRGVQEATNRLMARLTLVVDAPTAATIFSHFVEEYRFAAVATAESGVPHSAYDLRVPLPDGLNDFHKQVIVEAFRAYTDEVDAALARERQSGEDPMM
jgi:hypothetical protein